MSTNRDEQWVDRRRVQRRRPRDGTVATYWLNVPASGQGQYAELHNISEDGLRLGVGRAFEAGSHIEVSLQPPDEGEPVVCVVRVIWCSKSGSAHLVGGQFLERLSEEDLARLA